MISFIVFLVFVGLGLVGLGIKFATGDKHTLDAFFGAMFSKVSLTPLAIAAIVFIAASVVPYSMQLNDQFNIAFAEENIKLYEKYIADYTIASQKQISDYQTLQSQMAKTANALQLQFYSQQIDAVGNKLTDQIKAFNDKILDQQIEINRAKIRIVWRPKNKWFFGVN